MTGPRKDIIDRTGTYQMITSYVHRERVFERGERKAWLCRSLANWLLHMGMLATMRFVGFNEW